MGGGLQGHKIFFIINPQAGGGKAAAWWRDFLPCLEQQGLNFFWQFSHGGPKTARQVRQAVLAEGATAVVAVGGDGHLHDTLNGLIENDALIMPELVLAAYPAGSACDFARMIYINGGDTNSSALIKQLLHGETRRVDVGRAVFQDTAGVSRSAYFLNGSDVGLGAETCQRANARAGRLKRLLQNGQLAFLLAALQSLFAYRYGHIQVEADGESLNGQYLIAAIGNGRFMGGNMCLFPKAQPDDGLLDLLLVNKLPKLRVPPLFAKVYNGSLLQIKEVTYRQVKSVTITPEHPLTLELDGELPGCAPYSVQILPGLLPLLCPAQFSVDK